MRPPRLAVVLMLTAVLGAGCAEPRQPAVAVPTTHIVVTLQTRDKTQIDAAMEVLGARLKALGIGTFSAGAGDWITYDLPTADLPEREVLDDVLHRRGVLSLLAWPAAGQPAPVEGDAVPAGMQSLVDPATAITSAEVVDQNGARGVNVVLSPAASAAVSEFTARHVNGYMPLAMDGRILVSPIIQSQIDGGELLIQLTDDAPIDPAALAAILSSGPLPEGVIGR